MGWTWRTNRAVGLASTATSRAGPAASRPTPAGPSPALVPIGADDAHSAAGFEPRCSSLCYITMRKQLEPLTVLGRPIARPSLVPIAGSANTYLFVPGEEKDPAPIVPPLAADRALKPAPLPKKQEPEEVDPTPQYRWSWLDDRYIYYGSGRNVVAAHMREMGPEGWKGIQSIADRCNAVQEKRNELSGRARREQSRLRRVLGVDDTDDDTERLINLSDLYSGTLRTVHKHFVRIYSPGFTNFARLPSTFTDYTPPQTIADSTQGKMVGTVYTKLTDGSALALGTRMVKSTIEVIQRLAQGRPSEGGGGGGIAGLGGPGGASAL